MKENMIIKLTKEYLKLVILPYSLALLVWVLMIFTGSGFDWALAGGLSGSLMFTAWGWKVICLDAVKGRCSGLYRGLPASEIKQRWARVLAAAVGLLIILAGIAAMITVIWNKIQFWGAQYAFGSGGWGSRYFTRWLYEIYLEGGSTR